MDGNTTGENQVTKTPRLQQILDAAAELATQQGHAYVGVEHVVLAILADKAAVPTQVMQRMGIDTVAISTEITELMQTDGYKTPTMRATLLDGSTVEYGDR